jgi:hypothetical protein
MIIIKSIKNIPIRLSIERWNHITKRHPEMKKQKGKVLETVENPDLIQEGDFGELLAIKFFRSTPLTSKYLVVTYKEVSKVDGFIITAYFTNQPSQRRKAIWKR